MYRFTAGLVIGTNSLADEVRTAIADLPVQVQFEQREIGVWEDFAEKLDRTQPDVVLLEIRNLPDELPRVIRQVKAACSEPRVVIVHTCADPQLLLNAIRSNADEFVYSPLTDDLRKALERLEVERREKRAASEMRGKALGFLSVKGGCGATTMACHLAPELYRVSKKDVLLADYDVDTGIVPFVMKSHSTYSLMDAVENVTRLDPAFWKAIVSNGHLGVEVIGAPPRTPSRHVRKLDEFRKLVPFMKTQYGWVLLDLGRSLTSLSLSVLEELDELFVVTTLDIPALHVTKQLLRELGDAGFSGERTRVVLNRMPRRPDVTVPELEKVLSSSIYATVTDDHAGLFEAYAGGGLVEPGSVLGRDFTRLAMRIAGVEEPVKKKRTFLAL